MQECTLSCLQETFRARYRSSLRKNEYLSMKQAKPLKIKNPAFTGSVENTENDGYNDQKDAGIKKWV